MKLFSSPHQRLRFLSLLLPSLVLVMLFVNPVHPRLKVQTEFMNHATRSIIPVNTADSQLVIYSKVRDSLDKIAKWNQQRLGQIDASVYVFFGGVTRIDECDTCASVNDNSKRSKHFVSLKGYTMKEGVGFRLVKDKYVIDQYAIADGENSSMQSQESGVRLSNPGPGGKGITVMIPVSKSLYNMLKIAMYLLFAIAVIAVIWFVRMPIRLLNNIGEGKPFQPENIRYINRFGWGIIIICLAGAIIPKLIQLILSSTIPNGVYFPFWTAIFENEMGFFLGLGILILAAAFKKGYQLQKDQDLTI